MSDVMAFIRNRSGIIAAVSAIVGFTFGVLGAYHVVHAQSEPQILLRQATEGNPMASFDQTPGAGGVLILLRNDSTVPIEVIDAAFSRTSAAPPLYIAPDTVSPGSEVNVYVPVPGECSASGLSDSPTVPPVQIFVYAHIPGTPVQSVPVEVIGTFARVMAACHAQGHH
jgi:hypothetical protein